MVAVAKMPEQPGTADDFRHELARILASATFAKAAKQRDLLRWLVEHAVSGEINAFSQFAIATGAFGYSPSFDPATDCGVRTATGRLRSKLREYYNTEGRLNRFQIVIEKEQYEPRLVASESLPPASAPPCKAQSAKLAVLVLPFLPIGFRDDTHLCAGMTSNLMRALAASGQARVVPWTTANWLATKTGDKREYHRLVGADVLLEGLVEEVSASGLRVTVQWIDGLTGINDAFIEVRGDRGDTFELCNDIAVQLAHRLRITYDERNRLQVTTRHSTDQGALAFYLKAREAVLTLTPHGTRRAFHLLERALGRDPYFAAAHSLLAETHLSAGESGMAPFKEHGALAQESADRALALAPELGDALSAQGAVNLLHNWDRYQAEQTLDLACRDTLADGASYWPQILQLSYGHCQEAALNLEEWGRLDPGSGAKASRTCGLWYHARQFELAIQWGLRALELDPENVRTRILLAGSYIEAGKHEQGLRIARSAFEMEPEFSQVQHALVIVLAQAGQRSEARQVLSRWEQRGDAGYQSPIAMAAAYGWVGETSRAIEIMHQAIEDRDGDCVYARTGPYLAPLHSQPQFDRMLTEAGLPE